MKGIKFDENTKAIVIVEKGDRFVVLSPNASAIIIEDSENENEGAKITNLFPEELPNTELPFSVSLAACVRVFLDDTDWVQQAHKRIEEASKNKEA